MTTSARLSAVAAFASTTFAVSLASAHVRLVYPTPRYATPTMMNSSTDIKDPPCGRAGGVRTTDTTRITVLEPGATIMVQFNETIDHDGFFRISFDDDGQDAFVAPSMRSQVQTGPTFTLPVLLDNITDKSGGSYTVAVTLPNVECERCTLQLIQVMVADDVMTWDPGADADIYFTCADIALRRTGGMGGMGGMSSGGAGGRAGSGGAPNGGAGGNSMGGTGGTAGNDVVAGAGGAATGGSPAGGAGNGGSTTGGSAGTGTATGGVATGGVSTGGSGGAPSMGGTPASGGASSGGTSAGGTTEPPAPPSDEGGCRMAPASKGGHAFLAAAALALAVAVRRRRGSRSFAA